MRQHGITLFLYQNLLKWWQAGWWYRLVIPGIQRRLWQEDCIFKKGVDCRPSSHGFHKKMFKKWLKLCLKSRALSSMQKFLGPVTKTSKSTKQASPLSDEGSSCPIQLSLPWIAIPRLHHSSLQPFYPKGSFNVSVSVLSDLVWFIRIDANSRKPCTPCLDGFYESYLAMLLTWCLSICLISQKGKRNLFQAELTHYCFSWNVWHTGLLQSDRSAVLFWDLWI